MRVNIASRLKDSIESLFLNTIFEVLDDFISDEIDSLEFKLFTVEEIQDHSLYDIRIKHIYPYDKSETEIGIDLIVEADIEVYERNRHDDDQELTSTWFWLNCSCDLNDFRDSFKIVSVEVYSKNMNKGKQYLDQALVPYIDKTNYDVFAKELLAKYYPEALKIPMRIDPYVLAEKVGVSVIEKRIDKDCLIFGQTFFKDKSASFYDEDSGSYKEEIVREGTIVVDPHNYFLRNVGSVSNTIAHEIVHWVYHKKAFLLERAFNKELTNMTSLISGGMENTDNNISAQIMEKQANALAPRILMPLAPFKTKLFSLIKDLSDGLDEIDRLDVMPKVIEELASYFGVSKQSAKIRLLETGNRSVLGINIYLDGKYVVPHKVSDGLKWPIERTYTIDPVDAVIASVVDLELSKLLKSGKYIYVDGHFVVNDPAYIQQNFFAELELTDYARLNIDKCCLPFKISITEGTHISQDYIIHCILCRDSESTIKFGYSFDKDVLTIEEESEQMLSYLNDISEFLKDFPRSFPNALQACIEWSEMSQNEIAERSGVDVKTIQRLKNGETRNPDIKTIICLCIGMQLYPEISYALINESSYRLGNSQRDIAYKFILNTCYTMTIDECNKHLQTFGVEAV